MIWEYWLPLARRNARALGRISTGGGLMSGFLIGSGQVLLGLVVLLAGVLAGMQSARWESVAAALERDLTR
ncbi:MAG: hypothetical protein RJB26_273 [Pseudomonadota bacterium]